MPSTKSGVCRNYELYFREHLDEIREHLVLVNRM